MYFQRKLLALAFGKPQNLHVTARCFGKNASTVPIDNIKRDMTNPFVFSVRSRKEDNTVYQVDTSLGICTCPCGENGNACAHQAAVALHYGGSNLNFIPQSSFFIYFMIQNSYMKYWMNMEISRNGYGISQFYNVEGFIELF
jgi:hypothetical protein